MGHALLASEQSLEPRFFTTGSILDDSIDRFQRGFNARFSPEGVPQWDSPSHESQQTLLRKGPYSISSLPAYQGTLRRTDVEVARRAIEQIKIGREARDTRKRFADESQWVEQHRSEFAGKWVALLGNELLASADLASDVFQAVADIHPIPLVIRIEDEHLPFAGW